MILRIVLLLVLLTALGSWLYFVAETPEPGYVLIAFEGFRFESSLWFSLALLLGFWLLWRLGGWLISLLGASGRVLNPWSRRNHQRRVQWAAEQGLLDLSEGRWARALRHLRRAAEGDSRPLMHYLGAARAAHQLGQVDESERLLELALQRQPKAELAIALAHARMQQERGELDAARDTLEAMSQRHPRHQGVLQQLVEVQRQRADWSALLGLLAEVHKAGLFNEQAYAALELEVCLGRLRAAGQQACDSQPANPQALQTLWQQFSAGHRQRPELLLEYARQLQRAGAEADAEALLRGALKRGYQAPMAALYGTLRGREPARQLQLAESWLPEHGGDPQLLLCLARLCLQNQLWGKAREYFEGSLKLLRSATTCAELGRLLEQLGDLQRSNQLFQESLHLLEVPLPALPVPAPRQT